MDIITDCQGISDLCSLNYILKMASLMKSEGIKNYIFIILNLFSSVIYELIQKVFTFFLGLLWWFGQLYPSTPIVSSMLIKEQDISIVCAECFLMWALHYSMNQ